MRHPVCGVSEKRRETESRSINLSGNLHWQATTAQSSPRIPTEVNPSRLIALKVYSEK